MAKGVTFTEDSARRIAGAVRRVEATGPNLGRPPGRGRSGPSKYGWLFEVGSVENGTCTVGRRNSATGDDVLDPELSGVYYETDNAPAVGDIGIVARLGNGGFFFFPGGAGDMRMETTPIQIEVRTDDPDSPETGQIWLRSDL